jgi:hypothetical protein
MVSARASSPFASDHCSMRFVSAAVARSFVADVPARVVCFFLGIGASLLQKPRQGALAEACLQFSCAWEGKENRSVWNDSTKYG